MFDVCTTGVTAHIDTIFKFLPHTRVNMGASIFFAASDINVNYDEKQLTEKRIFELFLLTVQVS
jgi:copper chaperone CopZ